MKANLEDGFACVSVTLLHTWALLKLSDCAKSCLLMLVADTWGVTAKKPGYVSSLTRGQLAVKMKSSWTRSGIYKAIEKLVSANVVFKAENGCLGISSRTLEYQTDEFQEKVHQLNQTRRRVFDNISNSPVGDTNSPHGDNNSPVGDTNSPRGDNNSPVGDIDSPRGDTHIDDAAAKKRTDGRASSTATLETARTNLGELVKAFVSLVASKTLRAEARVFEDVKSVRTTAVKLFHALALVYRAVDGGAFPRNLPNAITDAACNPHNWAEQDPMLLLENLRQKRKQAEFHRLIQVAKEKADKARYQEHLRKRREDDARIQMKRKREIHAQAKTEAADEARTNESGSDETDTDEKTP